MILKLPRFKLRCGKLLIAFVLSTGLPTLLNTPALQAEATFISCEMSFESNARLKRFAKGEVAKFEISEKPANLSGIGFDDENGTPVTVLADEMVSSMNKYIKELIVK